MGAIDFAPERLFPDMGRAVYKVHADIAGHFIASRVMPQKKEKRHRIRACDSLEMATARDEVKQVMVKGFRKKRALQAVRAKLLEQMEEVADQECKQEMAAIVEEAVRKEYSALYLRRKRFMRKACMYKWTYFCTFTYDSEKIETDELFREKLNNKLMNLANRHGWKCAGVWERGEQGERLHFHCLMYIPDGQMVGEIVEERKWSTKRGRLETRLVNTEFLEDFGINEFAPIDDARLKDAVDYVTKYLAKSGEKIRYSRGIPSEILIDLNHGDMYLDYSAADSIMSLLIDGRISWERDIAVFNTKKEKALRRLVTIRDGRSLSPPMAARQAS